jgi:hypothetical protein
MSAEPLPYCNFAVAARHAVIAAAGCDAESLGPIERPRAFPDGRYRNARVGHELRLPASLVINHLAPLQGPSSHEVDSNIIIIIKGRPNLRLQPSNRMQ